MENTSPWIDKCEGFTTKQGQHSQAFFVETGSTNLEAPASDYEFHEHGC